MHFTRTNRSTTRRRAGVVFIALSLVLAACGGSATPDDEEAAGSTDIEATDEGSADPTPADDASLQGEPPSGTLRIAAAQEPETLDFMATTQGNVAMRTVNVVETLFAFDDEWAPQPMLVEDYSVNDDGTVHELTLREVNFHDGAPLTAADAIASLERWISVDSRAASWFESLEGMEATGDRALEIRFSAPIGLLPSYLATTTAGIIPASAAEAAGSGVLEPDQLIGTGPFKFESWSSGVSLILVANSDYQSREEPSSGYAGAKRPGVERIEFIPILEESARLAGLQTGEYQYAEALSNDQLDAIEGAADLYPAPRVIGSVAALLNSQSPVIGDPDIRRALLVALDMEQVGLAIGPEELWNLSPAIPTSNSQYASDVGADAWNAADPEEAARLLAETDYDGTPLTVISTSTPATFAFAIMLQEQLGAADIDVQLEQMEVAVMQERRAQETGWDIAMGQLNAVPDASQQTNFYCGNTSGGYCSEEMDALMRDFAQALDDEERAKAHEAIQELYYQDLPYIKGPENLYLNGARAELVDFDPTSLAVPRFWNARIEE